MTTAIAPARTGAASGRATVVALAAREAHRLVLNPLFLFAVGMALWITLDAPSPGTVTEIDEVVPYPAIFLGGFSMMAMFWLTRSMGASEPAVGVAPTTLPRRTAALCAAAIVPFGCGCLTLLLFLNAFPVGGPEYGAFSRPAQVAILAGQIALPSLGGPLLGVALGRWVRFPGAGLVLFLVLFGWGNLVTILAIWHPGPAPFAVLRMFSPFAFFTLHAEPGHVTAWRGSPWFFLGWQLALCVIAVLVALLRGAEGQARARIIRALALTAAVAVILLVLAGTGGFAHPVTV